MTVSALCVHDSGESRVAEARVKTPSPAAPGLPPNGPGGRNEKRAPTVSSPAGGCTVSSPASEASVGGGVVGRSGPMTEGAERSEDGEAPPIAHLAIR